MYAVNHIGAYLDDGHIDTTSVPGMPQTQYIPDLQIDETSIINDTLNWVKIEGSFTANGTEKFITIGNFHDLAGTSHIYVNPNALGGGTCYLVDDVSVIESDHVAFAGNDTIVAVNDSMFLGEAAVPYVWYDGQGHVLDSTSGGIWVHPTLGSNKYKVKQTLCGVVTWDSVVVTGVPEVAPSISPQGGRLKVWPNPNSGAFIVSENIDSREATIEVTNAIGQVVYNEQAESPGGKLNKQIVLKAPSGLYFLKIRTEQGTNVVRLVVE
jgi:hypothetical protein